MKVPPRRSLCAALFSSFFKTPNMRNLSLSLSPSADAAAAAAAVFFWGGIMNFSPSPQGFDDDEVCLDSRGASFQYVASIYFALTVLWYRRLGLNGQNFFFSSSTLQQATSAD